MIALGDLVVRVEDHRAEVLVVDRAAVGRGRLLDRVAPGLAVFG